MTEPIPTKAVATVNPERAARIPMKARGIELGTMEDAIRFCIYVESSGIGSGSGVDTRDKALVVIQTGMEAGLTPMAALRMLYLVSSGGRFNLGWRGEGMLAVIRRSGTCKLTPSFRWEGEEGADEGTAG